MIVGDLAVPDHHVVREHPAYRLVEAAADGLVRHLELLEDLCISRAHKLEGFLHEVDGLRRRVGYEVGPRPAPLEGVGPLLRIFHSKLVSGMVEVPGRLISTLLPVALT